MRDIQQVLREKEEELARITQEIEALRLVMRLLATDGADKSRPALSREPVAAQRVKDFP
jgi:hypothetical protein